jgi:integrase
MLNMAKERNGTLMVGAWIERERARPFIEESEGSHGRKSEIIRVRREDLDSRSLTLTVPVRDERDRPKSGKARMLPITRELAKAIEKCASGPEGLVVGREVWTTPDQLSKLLGPVWLAAGVTGGVRLHRLRHYWASALHRGS